MLDQWPEIWEPNVASSLSGMRGGSGLDPRLPEMAGHPAVQQLVTALSLLKELYPSLHDHLMAYRCNAAWRQERTVVKFLGPQGRMLEGPGWTKTRLVPSWIEPSKVQVAELWLVRAIPGPFSLPKELWNGLTKLKGG